MRHCWSSPARAVRTEGTGSEPRVSGSRIIAQAVCRLSQDSNQLLPRACAYDPDQQAAANKVWSWSRKNILAAAATLLGGAATYLQQPARLEGLRVSASPEEELRSKQYPAWVYELASSPAETSMLTSNTLLSEEHPMLKRDHMFSALLRHDMVEDMSVFYNVEQRRVSSVIKLGNEICGYPRIVHGGLTAAVVDECLGFLMFALKHQRALPFWGPAYTVHLEVDYKNKIQAGRLLLCEVEVESMEGRKLWMKAMVRDGPEGKVYATARALFVAPKTQRLIRDGVKLVLHKLFPSSASVE
ncbi:hypothetical protein WJX74_010745 [Apatococcus lobatus]|uniref:Thioesterase domain-containing protein n=1 Tax=Apatococcus lobatus TaxID=904363 RepID=A0AAW1QJX0_9CHLO